MCVAEYFYLFNDNPFTPQLLLLLPNERECFLISQFVDVEKSLLSVEFLRS